MIHVPETSETRLFRFALTLAVPILLAGILLPRDAQSQRRKEDDETPVFREYRGVQIGMTADEARKKLGGPKEKGEEQDFFVLNDNETAQIVYDKDHKVVTISADFVSGATGTPTPNVVFGSEIAPKPDGSLYKMVRYTKAGFWVSFSRTAGNSPMTSVTIQKLQ